MVACRAREARVTWRRVVEEAPHAELRVLHAGSLHFLLPATYTGKSCVVACHARKARVACDALQFRSNELLLAIDMQ